jgi:hypothetical protein
MEDSDKRDGSRYNFDEIKNWDDDGDRFLVE